jgi:CRISPR-associated protein Cmr6
MSEMGNVGYLFYKKIYENKEELSLETFKVNAEVIEKILKYKLNKKLNNEEVKELETFKLKTTYPGLLIGSGYTHDSGEEEDFKLGFFFDYTTGLPVIPGSSIKGVLRSVFPSEKDDEEKREGKREYINEILSKNFSFEEIKKIELEIFEGIKDGEKMSMKIRDIFYDAEIVEVAGKIFEDDYLCPHGDNPLKNPTPLRFLKVAPGVVFEFRFDLKEGILTKEGKKSLFKRILSELGVGAKTNVGYGQFDEKYANIKEKFKIKNEEKKRDLEEERLKKEKEEKLALMSEIERDLLLLSSYGKKEEHKIMEMFKKIEYYTAEKQIALANLLKAKFKEIGKLENKVSSKQKLKNERLEEILGKQI